MPSAKCSAYRRQRTCRKRRGRSGRRKRPAARTDNNYRSVERSGMVRLGTPEFKPYGAGEQGPLRTATTDDPTRCVQSHGSADKTSPGYVPALDRRRLLSGTALRVRFCNTVSLFSACFTDHCLAGVCETELFPSTFGQAASKQNQRGDTSTQQAPGPGLGNL